MLTIRHEQMAAFTDTADESYVTRMVRYIANDYPVQFEAMGYAAAREFVIKAIQKGSVNNIKTEGGVAVYIQLMVEFGESFENSRDKDWAHEMISHPTLPARLKLDLMRQRMTALSQGRVIVPFPG